jgi:hypothetical protein
VGYNWKISLRENMLEGLTLDTRLVIRVSSVESEGRIASLFLNNAQIIQSTLDEYDARPNFSELLGLGALRVANQSDESKPLEFGVERSITLGGLEELGPNVSSSTEEENLLLRRRHPDKMIEVALKGVVEEKSNMWRELERAPNIQLAFIHRRNRAQNLKLHPRKVDCRKSTCC